MRALFGTARPARMRFELPDQQLELRLGVSGFFGPADHRLGGAGLVGGQRCLKKPLSRGFFFCLFKRSL
jgi:hypothetical protein